MIYHTGKHPENNFQTISKAGRKASAVNQSIAGKVDQNFRTSM
jgi:hypothetical protein